MECNKDEAIRCLEIAMEAMKLGDYSKAIRLKEKSARLYPLTTYDKDFPPMPKKNKAKSTTAKPASKPKKPAVKKRKYTKEQLRAVKEVLASDKTYYQILSIERSATEIQIKKAYKKQALFFHPDKNSAPGTEEAFKLIGKAFDILSNSYKRAIYDIGGDVDGTGCRSYNAQEQQKQQYAY